MGASELLDRTGCADETPSTHEVVLSLLGAARKL